MPKSIQDASYSQDIRGSSLTKGRPMLGLVEGNLQSLSAKFSALSKWLSITTFAKKSKFVVEQQFLNSLQVDVNAALDEVDLVSTLKCVCMEVDEENNFLRKEVQKIACENKDLKWEISYYLEKIYDGEIKLESLYHDKVILGYPSSHDQLENGYTLAADDIQIWNETGAHDSRWNLQLAQNMSPTIQEIYKLINEHDIGEALELTGTIIDNNDEMSPTLASVIEIIARRFYEEEFYDVCVKLMKRVLDWRIIDYGLKGEIIPASLCCIAVSYKQMNENKLSVATIHEAIDLLIYASIKTKEREILAKKLTRLGQLLVPCGQVKESFSVMHEALQLVQQELPVMESQWCDLIHRMVHVCNDNQYYDDAIILCAAVVDYYHAQYFGPISEKNPTVYEIAYWRQLEERGNVDTSTCENQLMPPVTVLNRLFESILREIALAFAACYEFRAASIIEGYIRDCSKTLYACPSNMGIKFRRNQSVLTPFLKANLLGHPEIEFRKRKRKQKNKFSSLFRVKQSENYKAK